jgi:hypothetical protein
MTRLFEDAIDRARALPAERQDAIAAIILEEISDEARWDAAFAKSQGLLGEMADKARADFRAGHTREGGFDGS